MLDKETYQKMKRKYGIYSSWAIWMPEGDTPKSNTSDMGWVNDPNLLEYINTGFVFVGLNCANTHRDQTNGEKKIWANFHSDYARQNDYKLRYALKGTRFWGSYITDIIKDFPEVDSRKVKQYLSRHPEVIKDNITEFRKEIAMLGEVRILIALGGEVYRILSDYLEEYKIVKIMHYSNYIGKEDYRKTVLGELKSLKMQYKSI